MPALRLWSPQGELLASVGDDQSAQADGAAIARAFSGDGLAHREDIAGQDRLTSYIALDADSVLEIQQDYAPVEASVIKARQDLSLVLVVAGFALAFVLPTILWAALRGLRREYNRLLYLYKTGQAIRSTLDLTDVLEQTAYDATIFTRADLGVAVLVEEPTNELIVTASYDGHADLRSQHHRAVDEWHLRRSAVTGETLVAQESSLAYDALLGYEPKLNGPVQLICVAIQGRERTTALLMIVRTAHLGPFKPSEIQMVEEMAAQASMTVEQAVLFTKLRSYAEEIEVGYDSTLKVLSAALDTKDQNTHGHCERVARLTLTLAREMGVPNERLVDMERGALLHDVGKIGVPDSILRKPGKLSVEEYEVFKRHVSLGDSIVRDLPNIDLVRAGIRTHHERWDGQGYLVGLEGGEIPLIGRILAVADAFSAMTTSRPYRKAVDVNEALNRLGDAAGTQLEASLVAAFITGIETAPDAPMPGDDAGLIWLPASRVA